MVWPLSVRPLLSTMVPLMNTGRRTPLAAKNFSSAYTAALALSVSKMVSTSSMSTPPSYSPSSCSKYASTTSSYVMPRNAGFSTLGDTLSVLLVGPTAPATNLGPASGCAAMKRAVTRLASAAASLLMAYTVSRSCSS